MKIRIIYIDRTKEDLTVRYFTVYSQKQGTSEPFIHIETIPVGNRHIDLRLIESIIGINE